MKDDAYNRKNINIFLYTYNHENRKPACDPAGEDFDTVDGVIARLAEGGGPGLDPATGEGASCSCFNAAIASANCF